MLLLAPAQPRATLASRRVRWVLAAGSAFAAMLALLYLPFILAGGSDAAALGAFGSQWRFNPLLYRMVEALAPAAVARPYAALLIVVGIGMIIWRWQLHRTGTPVLPPLDAAFVLLLLLSPVVNPWYWLWALALSARLGRCWVAAGGVIAVLSYLNSTVLFEAALWPGSEPAAQYLVPWPLALIQVSVLLGAFFAGGGRIPLPRVVL